jgi:hypothetical protein
LLNLISLGQAPSLQTLRGRLIRPSFVRVLLWYYELVRLPVIVHHGCTFFLAARSLISKDNNGISRVPRKERLHVLGVFDLAGSGSVSRLRRCQCGLPHMGTSSAPRKRKFSRLNTLPMLSPANACHNPSRENSHGPGPVWFATPSLYKTFTYYSLPAFPGASPIFCSVLATHN